MCMTVGSGPEVDEDLEDVTATASQEAVLECTILPGDPPAKISWYKEAKEIYPGKRYQISYVDDVAKLVIKGVELGDAGLYRCEAVNKIGRVSTECGLTVNSKSCQLCYTFEIMSTNQTL